MVGRLAAHVERLAADFAGTAIFVWQFPESPSVPKRGNDLEAQAKRGGTAASATLGKRPAGGAVPRRGSIMWM